MDPGGCGCCGCEPCTLPKSTTLHFAVSITISGTVLTGSLPWPYAPGSAFGAGSLCYWDNTVVPVTLGVVAGHTYEATGGIWCQFNCTVLEVSIYKDGGLLQDYVWESPPGCKGGFVSLVLTLGSYTCGTLSIPFTHATLSFSGTLTL